MIKDMNKHLGFHFNFKYSSASEYLSVLNNEKIKFSTKTDDMFPYSMGPKGTWSGYFSSRPNSKSYFKKASAHFRAFSQLLSAQAFNSTADFEEIREARDQSLDAMSVAQHHDAITGTSKEFVNRDFVDRVDKAMHSNA
mmetsp:Transcript_17308/g.26701  ORF Transcript_17308/g.26701 Transcript_17308/m.26701 type:complete len:139 (+) Transcript_17308:527-943(+)